MTDWSKPSLTDPYASVLTELMNRDTSAATMTYSTDTNIPNGAIRWNPATYQFETYSSSGGNWSAWTTQFNIGKVLLGANSAAGTMQAVPRSQADALYQPAGNYAVLGGSGAQAFLVGNSTATTQQAVPRAQADGLYATIGGASTQAFAAKNFTATDFSGYKFSGSAGYYYMDGTDGAVRVPVGGAFYCQDTNGSAVPCAVGTATAGSHAVPLDQVGSLLNGVTSSPGTNSSFYANNNVSASEGDIGAKAPGQNSAYLFNSQSGWGLYSGSGGIIIEWNRSAGRIQMGGSIAISPASTTDEAVSLGQLQARTFVSAWQTLGANWTIRVAHNLGARPKAFGAYLVCVTAELGYAVGEAAGFDLDDGASHHGSNPVRANGSNLILATGDSTFRVVNQVNASTADWTAITLGNWRLVMWGSI